MSTQLHLSGVAASFVAHPLFSGLDLVVGPGDVVALVGPNGAGKSTLLRMIVGELPVEAGSIRRVPGSAQVGYLPQAVPEPEESILGYAARRTGVAVAHARYEAATAALAAGAPGAEEEFDAALQAWLGLGGADLEARLAETLSRLGLDTDLDHPLGALSGGQAARVGLVSILVSRYDALLLDEPTNNLDAAGLAEITAFVQRTEAPVIVASHDRRFMDEVATSVCELDIRQQRVAHFTGGWSDYREAKELERAHRLQERARYEAERAGLVAFAKRQEHWAGKARHQAHQDARDPSKGKVDWTVVESGAKKQEMRAARARDAVRRLEEPEQLRKEWDLRYSIAEAAAPADVVLALDGVVAAAGSFRVGPVTAHVSAGERVALVGDNGSGKTTLLRSALTGEVASGRVSWGARVSLGVLDQERSVISGEEPLVEVVAGAIGSDDAGEVRTLLAKFGLGSEHVLRPCSTLSLGERTRAALAVLQARAVNVLVLDEPTNHADVQAIEQLQEALAAFGGAILLVSHDRALVDALGVEATWEFTRVGDAATVEVRRR